MLPLLLMQCERQQPALPAPDAGRIARDAAPFVNRLGWLLLCRDENARHANSAWSPLSVRSCLAMLQAGARGGTRSQMDASLGALDAFTPVRRLYGHGPVVSLADLVIVDKGVTLKPGFEKALAHGEIRSVDLAADPGRECERINDWVAGRTKGRIMHFLDGIDPSVRVAALNACTFDAAWLHPFNPAESFEDVFHAPHADVQAMMMRRELPLAAERTADATLVVSLPYADPQNPSQEGDCAMVIIMPPDGVSPRDWLEQSGPDGLDGLLASCGGDVQRRWLTMPRFSVKTPRSELAQILGAAGMPDLFDPGACDLSAMASNRNLYVEEVVHACAVEVAEAGTKAGAATMAFMVESIVTPDRTVVIERPFAWFVYDRRVSMVLFCGIVNDPAAKPLH